ncbi:MAG: peptidylprolyl isomerase [Bacteroidales bacterium]
MKTSVKILLLSIAISAFFTKPANAQRYEKGLIDKTIALIGNDMVQLSTLESEVQMMMLQGVTSDKNLRCDVLQNLLIQKLFLTQARLDSLQVSPDNVENELNNRISNVLTSLGGEKAVEEYFNKPLFRLKQEWREALTEQFLVQEMRSNVAQSAPAVTPSDVEQYYKNAPEDSLPIIPTQYKYRQIAIYPNREVATLAVKERLLGFRERVLNGERFSTLATLYSQDPGSAARGGELGMAAKSMYWPAFSDVAIALKDGQVSQIVETPDGFHLIQMIKKEGDMFNARHILLRPEYTSQDRTKAFNKLDSIKNLITSDSLNFEMAARRFSQDPKSYINGGLVADEMSGSAYFVKDQLKVVDFNMLDQLQVGGVSEPFETTDNEGRNGNTIYKIVKLEEIIPSHIATYKDDFDILQEEARNKLAMEAIEDFIKKKRETTYIRIDPLFQNCPFLKEGWLK